MDFPIVDASPDDVYGIRRVQRLGWLCTYPNEKAGITKEEIEQKFAVDDTEEGQSAIEARKQGFKDPLIHTWVAKDKAEIVGFCVASKKDNKNTILALYVLPDYQGKGIGTNLIKASFDWLGDKQDIYVAVASYNNQAISFYKKNDFEETGEKGLLDESAKLPSGKTIPEVQLIKRGS